MDQFRKAEGWELAVFDEAFMRELKSAMGKNDGRHIATPKTETHESESHQGEDGADGRMEAPDDADKWP